MSLLDTASLIVTPNGYKEGKLYSVIPSDGSGDLSVTRATTATRVNSQGLVELVPYNLLQYSEDFSNGAWISGEVSLTSGQNSPLGTNTAFKITGTSATNAFLIQVGIPVTSGNTYTASVYLKGSTSGSVSLRVDSGSTAPNNPVSYTTEWQRFTYTFTAGATTATAILGGYNTWTGSEEIFVYGFQLVEGSVAKDYQKTETRLNIPRLDYSNGTCPSILVEPQRTNLIVNSSSFNSAGWLSPDTIITANTTTSPSGIQDADTIAFTTGLGGYVGQFFVQTGAYSFSIYAKYIDTQWLYIQNYNGGDFGAWFDIQNGVVGTIQSGVTASIEQAENGFYRCTITYNASILSASYYVFFNTTGNGSYARTGSSYFWGAQLEAGSYATSYIPTTSASVTRNADVISKTGISSLIGQTEGTLFWDVQKQLGENDVRLNISDGTTNNWLFVGVEFSNYTRIYCNVGGVNQMNIYGAQLSNDFHKIAFAYKANDFVLYVDGVQVASHTSGSVPNCSRIDINAAYPTSGAFATNNNKAVALWKTRLTNTQLAQLTTI